MNSAEIALHLACLDMERMIASNLGHPVNMEHVKKMEQNYNREANCRSVRKRLAEENRGEKA